MARNLIYPSTVLLLGLITFSSILGRSQETTLPALPPEIVSSLPLEIRENVTRTYEALQASPTNPTIMGQLGMIFQAYDQLELANQLYGMAVTAAPETFEWVYYQAVVLGELSRTGEAIKGLQRALEIAPQYLPARLRLAEYQYDDGHWEESIRLYRDILSDFPELAIAHYGLGMNLIALKSLDEATKHFRTACNLVPEFGAAHYALAQAYRDTGKIDSAKEHLALYQQYQLNRPVVGDGVMDAINQLKPANTQAQEQARRAITLAEQGDLSGAIKAHQKAVEFDPTLIQSHVQKGILHGQLGQFDLAEAALRKALEINPNSEEAFYNLGVLQMQRDQIDAGMKSFERVIQINPLNSAAWNSLGQLFERKGKLEEAESHYRKALKSNDSHRLARFNLGRLLIGKGQYQEAVREIEPALTPEDDRTPRLLFAISVAYARLGNVEKGIEFGERARSVAEEYGQTELAEAIDRDLIRLRELPK